MDNFSYWPGPMEGVMTPALIRAVSKLKLVDRWMTPFLRISNNVPRERIFREFLEPYLESGLPVTMQLMGTEAGYLAETARRVQKYPLAGINFNCGCPSKRVVSSGAGGGALRNLPHTFEILKALRDAVSACPFSVKLRTGWAEPEEQETIVPELCALGVEQIFMHYRTVRELYLPVAGRDERLKKTISLAGNIPVIVNGDFNTPEDFLTAREMGAAGVMCARGWMRDPALFTSSGVDVRDRLLEEVRLQNVPESKLIELKRLLGVICFGDRAAAPCPPATDEDGQ